MTVAELKGPPSKRPARAPRLRLRSPLRIWSMLPRPTVVGLPDLVMFAAGLALFYGIVEIGRNWLGPFRAQVEISRSPAALPVYAGYSLLRIALAYLLSLIFAIVYGYIAAYRPRAERFMIPLLDVLQSIPVLSFLPGVMLAMAALFPGRQLGVELGAVLLIFTGQVWNMAFSFYASLKSIPREMREAATIYRFNWWQRFLQVELPFATIGLVWNSMMSVAGAWFFLMACEQFTDFRLPGLGSYLQAAADSGDTRSILLGILTMVTVIVLMDQIIWRPVIAWAEKFKFEQVESTDAPSSWVLEFLRRSRGFGYLRKNMVRPVREQMVHYFAHQHEVQVQSSEESSSTVWLGRIVAVAALIAVGYSIVRVVLILVGLSGHDFREIGLGLGATILRVNAALVLGALWTIPVGVAVGFNSRLARIAQPLAQIAASVPATALFPVVLLVLIKLGGGLGIGSIVLLLLGTQWYILFNVIAGAAAYPGDLREAAANFHIDGLLWWRKVILPGIFPYFVTGAITASGGCWNAAIVAEVASWGDTKLVAHGLGAYIAAATDKGDMARVVLGVAVMSAFVVLFNRLLWRPLYAYSQRRLTLG